MIEDPELCWHTDTTAEKINSREFPRLKRIMNDPNFYTDTRHLQNGGEQDKLVDK